MAETEYEVHKGPGMSGILSPVKLALATGKTSSFAARSMTSIMLARTRKDPHLPGLQRVTPAVLTSVFGEELMLLGAGEIHRREIAPGVLKRRSHEVDQALSLFHERGFLNDASSYHSTPEPPRDFTYKPARVSNIRYQRLAFDSGFEPLDGLPGGERWLSHTANQRAYAHVLEHRGDPRPWLIFLHPYGMGRPMDLVFAGALKYHCELGFNVLLPVLPMHGSRRTGRVSGEGMLSLEWLDNLHALTQTVWDVRRCIAWIRERGALSVMLHGMSLGGYVTALVAGLEELDCAIIGAGSATLHEPLTAACTRSPRIRRPMEQYDLLGDRIDALHHVITPAALPCRVPHERRFIYAGIADRVTLPPRSRQLWEQWDRPRIMWSPTSHVTTLTSPKMRHFVRKSLESCAWGSAAGQTPGASALPETRTG